VSPENKARGAARAPRFKPYPAYKDSGVQWLGEIPAHWDVQRLKTIAAVQLSNVDKKSVEGQESVRLCNYVNVYYSDRIGPDLDFMAATATPEQVRRFSLRAGDVLITKDSESWTDIAVPAVVTSDLPDVLCGYHLALVRPASDCDGAFLARAFSAIGPRDQFQVAANGITRFGLGGDAIRTGLFATPPLQEQHAIAAFLDRETARIDALVAKNERLIGLLQEKRTALITRGVTKGLDPNVPMKDSGVEWLGEIPAHWKVTHLKHAASHVVDCPHGSDYFVIRTADVTAGLLDLSEARRVDKAEFRKRIRRLPVLSDDIVYSREGERFGFAAMVPTGMSVCLGQRMMQFRVRSEWLPLFLMWQLNGRFVYQQAALDTTGATSPHVNVETIRNFWLAEPPTPDQRAIADFLGLETAKIDLLIAKVRDAIDRLKELRTALISAAVTGKIDVREAAAGGDGVAETGGSGR